MSSEKFNSKFLLSLFAVAIKDRKIASILVQYMEMDFLPNKEYQSVLTQIKKHIKIHKKSPSISLLFQKFDDDDDVFYLLEDIEDANIDLSIDETIEELQKFIINAKFIKEYKEMGALFNKNKKDEAVKRLIGLSESFSDFSIKKETFDAVLGGFAERNIDAMASNNLDTSKFDRKVIFGIDPLDALTHGIERKQVICFLAASGGGKTKAMRWVASTNARMGANVLHIQLEGSKEEALAGYGATLSGVHSSTIQHGAMDVEKLSDLENAFGKIEGEIYVKTFEQFAKSPTTSDVRRMIQDIQKSHNIRIDLIVVDYLELLNTADGKNWSPNDERHRRTKIADELKDISVEFDNVVLTATQANDINPTDLNNQNFLLTRHNVSEAKGIIKPLTMFITINRTVDEVRENRLRLFVDKSRFTRAGHIFDICTDYSADRFYDRKKTENISIISE
jgi:replicative DNA helicase|tara:strand:- start:929 stop:2278 length:1350 start_codon:yes stop_codon:yes gene_type:complete